MKISRIFLVFAFLCVAMPVYAQRTITSGSFDYYIGRFTTTDRWETDHRWTMYGTDSFYSTVTLGEFQFTEIMEVRRIGMTVPAYTLNYTVAQSKGNIAINSTTGSININYGNIGNPNSTNMSFNIPAHTVQFDVWDLPFTMQGNIAMFYGYTPLSNPQFTTPISGSGTVHLKYMRQDRNIKAYFLKSAHFVFAAPPAVKADSPSDKN